MYVKDLSNLTGISIQTLHHYDRVGLLKPSLRLENGYRIYSEGDLLKLKGIIALKFFGFQLKKIQALLTPHAESLGYFEEQSELLEKKALRLLDTSKILKGIISDTSNDKFTAWKVIIKLIEVYQMKQKLNSSWKKEGFTPSDELNESKTLNSLWEVNPAEDCKTNWDNLVNEITLNLDNDPKSSVGIDIGKRYVSLRKKIFTQIFEEKTPLNPAILSWIDKATEAYWGNYMGEFLTKAEDKIPDQTIFKLWNEIFEDLNDEKNARKKEIYDIFLFDENVSEKAKEWLQILKDLTTSNRNFL